MRGLTPLAEPRARAWRWRLCSRVLGVVLSASAANALALPAGASLALCAAPRAGCLLPHGHGSCGWFGVTGCAARAGRQHSGRGIVLSARAAESFAEYYARRQAAEAGTVQGLDGGS